MIFSSLIVKELQKSIIKGDKAMIYVWIHFVTPFFLAISLSYIYIYIFLLPPAHMVPYLGIILLSTGTLQDLFFQLIKVKC